MAEPDAAVIALLEPLTTPVELTSGRNLFAFPMVTPDSARPALAVFVTPTGGDLNQRLCGVTTNHSRSSVQVMVRSDGSDYDRGLALARACWTALHCPTTPSGYVDVAVREPQPTYVGRQGEGRHVWTLNVVLVRAA